MLAGKQHVARNPVARSWEGFYYFPEGVDVVTGAPQLSDPAGRVQDIQLVADLLCRLG